jgi:MoaA/NifB/PqqE/SkfB family radical SAM enzyme
MPIGRGKDTIELMPTPEQRVQLYRKWEYLLSEKKYCVADFWNSGVLTDGCIAQGRRGGYLHIDWNGNITHCVFIPYVVGYHHPGSGRRQKPGKHPEVTYAAKRKEMAEAVLFGSFGSP